MLTGNRNRWINPPVAIKCNQCGCEFIKHLCHIRNRNYCSRECYHLSLIGIQQSEITKALRASKLSGSLSPTWKGGESRQYKRGYKSEQFKHWRDEVFKRDNYICQSCSQRGGYLTAHHIKSFAKYPELRYEISNGKTLCPTCHAKTDNFRAKAV